MNGLIAVPGMDENTCGAIVYWRLCGTLDVDRLDDVWSARGLDEELLPSMPEPRKALARAMKTIAEVTSEGKSFVRPLRGVEDGFVIVHEAYVDGRPLHTNGEEAQLTKIGGVEITKADEDTASMIMRAYTHHRNHITQQDMSGWLCRLVRMSHAVGLRDTGGIYFVPRTALTQWRLYVGAIRECSSNDMFEIPALKSDEAVRSVIDALKVEAEQEADEIEKAINDSIDASSTGKLHGKVAKHRTESAQKMSAKLRVYEELLGAALPELHGRLDALTARLGAAIMLEGA